MTVAFAQQGSRAELIAVAARSSGAFLFSALATGLVAANHGGYWPTSWGWATLAFASTALVALTLSDDRPTALELGWVAGLVGVCVWTAASMIWTASQTQTALEVERSLQYAALAAAALAILRRDRIAGAIWGVWAGASLVCIYALATRLLPERIGVTDAMAGSRLATPLGYWNGLGLVAATAALLAVGLVVEGRPLVPRILTGVSLPLLLSTLYLTYSRGAWVALAAAILVVLALSPRRLMLLTAFFLLALPAASSIGLAYHQTALRRVDATRAAAVNAGHSLLWQLALVATAAGAGVAAWAFGSSRIHPSRVVRLAYGAAIATAAIVVIAGSIVHYGGPSGTWARLRTSVEGTVPRTGPDISKRLFSLSSNGRIDQWNVALDDWRAHRILGKGAGTYAQSWMASRSANGKVLDVHNLYLETLAELGIVGLVLLSAALVLPLGGAVRGRAEPLVAVAAGGYAAWLVHVVYDWDWELPGATLPALLCAGAILAARRPGREVRVPTRPLVAATCVVVGLVGVGSLAGNRSLAQSAAAAAQGKGAAALADARRARRLQPWSSEPWAQIASIRLGNGDRNGALAAYRRAVAKDSRDWSLWLSLASLARGAERRQAIVRLRTLAPAIAQTIGAGGGA